ncbi:MAG: hypothetical protein O9282_07970 [Flavobacterium sp.]|jgi:hypothetical protein|uniref:hypothetical protein n=1 Tax=Flavobacterium sp. TaxID=239 RepID=UPI0022BEC41B|nr:hypothetical protein [Flavobacterium sp.]MCZ8331232.1 hypothetical protein [Flavobacterium sp.]
MTQEEKILINVNYLLIGSKLNALKLTLTDKQLEVYHNHLLDEAEKVKPTLIKLLKSAEQVDEVLTNFLK